MNRTDFEVMVRRMCDAVPQEFLDGVVEVTVSGRAMPHPARPDVYTLGECTPLPAESDDRDAIQSRIVLYHGSFVALAQLDDEFDWRREAWDTLTHELRHHLEWRARAPDLEAFDNAVEQNFARQEGESFDATFYRDGDSVIEGVYRVEGDYFLEQVAGTVPAAARFSWHGIGYRVSVPPDATLPAYLTIQGVADPPPGDLVLVLQAKVGLRTLFRSRPTFRATVQAERER